MSAVRTVWAVFTPLPCGDSGSVFIELDCVLHSGLLNAPPMSWHHLLGAWPPSESSSDLLAVYSASRRLQTPFLSLFFISSVSILVYTHIRTHAHTSHAHTSHAHTRTHRDTCRALKTWMYKHHMLASQGVQTERDYLCALFLLCSVSIKVPETLSALFAQVCVSVCVCVHPFIRFMCFFYGCTFMWPPHFATVLFFCSASIFFCIVL